MIRFLPLAALLVVAACSPAADPADVDTPATADPAAETSAAAPALPDSAVRHVVVFRFLPEATEAQIAEVTAGFRALQDSIPGILAFEHGVNNSPEGKNLGFTHAYTLTFEDAAARDAYLPHPQHVAYVERLGSIGVLDDAFVVDYVPRP